VVALLTPFRWRGIVVIAFAAFALAGAPAAEVTSACYPLGAIALASTTKSLADGDEPTVNFPHGVSLTVAPGWMIKSSWATGVWLNNADNSAEMEADAGAPNAPNINDEAAFDNNQAIGADGYTNVVQVPQGGVQTLQGKNFTQSLQTNFTADIQNNQGVEQIWGIWVTLYNPSTQIAGSIEFRAASPDALQAAMPDAKAMLSSML
jgi:hypothetical protein